MADFSTSVSAWVDRAKGRGTAVLRGVAMEAVARVQGLTPVRTGYLRSNWSAVLEGDAVPLPGAPTQRALHEAKLGDVVLVVNPVRYARSIEYGFVGQDAAGHHRNQPGHGMVQQVVTEMPQLADRVVKEIAG